MEELRKEAKELGIKDAETLNKTQLRAAIKAAKANNAKMSEYREKAETLGVDLTGLDDASIIVAVDQAEADAEAEAQAQAKAELLNQKVELLVKHAGIENFEELTPDELEKILEEKAAANKTALENIDTASDEVKVDDRKTDKKFKAENGKEYMFADEAPGAFRYLGQMRTQKQWMADADSMELMVAGNVHYLTLKK